MSSLLSCALTQRLKLPAKTLQLTEAGLRASFRLRFGFITRRDLCFALVAYGSMDYEYIGFEQLRNYMTYLLDRYLFRFL